jgi:transposase-like protein
MKCNHCGSIKIWKAGKAYQASGEKQKYKCRDCHRFSVGSTSILND